MTEHPLIHLNTQANEVRTLIKPKELDCRNIIRDGDILLEIECVDKTIILYITKEMQCAKKR